MKIIEIQTLAQAIAFLQTTPAAKKVKFSYMLARNKKLIAGVLEAANSSLGTEQETQTLARYEDERVSRMKAAAVRGEDGEPVMVDGAFTFPGGDKQRDEILDELEKEFPGARKQIEERSEKYREIMQQEEDVTFFKLPLSEWPDLPENVPGDIMDVMIVLVKDED